MTKSIFLDLALHFPPHFRKPRNFFGIFSPQLETQLGKLKSTASWYSSPDQDKESAAWIISQVLNTHYITLYVSFILKCKKTRKNHQTMSWYKADESPELKGTLLMDTSWQSGPTCWLKNICFINNPLALPGTNKSFQMDALGCKAIRDYGKIKHVSMLFLSRKSLSWRI